jgi:hypothetical protein
VVVALGGLGVEVAERLEEAGFGVGRQVLLRHPEAPESPDAIVAEIVGHAERLLGFDAMVTGEIGDERRPSLDVYFVADIAEEAIAKALPAVVGAAGQRLMSRFSNIFPSHDVPNLTLCPVVALSTLRSAEARHYDGALAALEAVAVEVGKGGEVSPVSRVFVVEQQTARYELRRGEIVSTIAGFLSLVAGTDMREQEPLRSFLRSDLGQSRDKRLFASFGCATLELGLSRYCIQRAAGELVEGMRAAAGAAAGEHAAAADRLVPAPDDVVAALSAPEHGDDLVALLRAHTPHIDFPEIHERDSPEQIRDIAYGWGWFDALEAAVKAQVERLDQREMDEVSRVADERGLARLRRLTGSIRRAIREAEASGPHGWAQALRLAEQVELRARRHVDDLSDSLRSEALPAFPAPTAVESAFRELREESTLRPRPYRMVVFGVMVALMAAALLHHVPKWLVVCVIQRAISPFALAPSSMDVRVVGFGHYLIDPPWVFLWLAMVFTTLALFALERRRRKRHAALLGARDDLRAAVRRYLTDDVGASVRRYYESRLRFSLRAWALRMLSRVRDLAAREVVRLSRVGTALDRLGRELESETARSEAAARESGDLVYRTALSPELLRATYEASRPGGDLAHRLFAWLEEEGDAGGEVPGFLFRDRLERFIAPHTEPSPAILAELAGPMVSDFVARRHGKLSVPLEVTGHDERQVEQRHLFAPDWALPSLETLRERLRTLPEVKAHGDPDRVHLVSLQTALPRKAIRLPRGGA